MATSDSSNGAPHSAESTSAAGAWLSLALAAGDIGLWKWELETQRVICDEFTAQLLSIDPDTAQNGMILEMFFHAVLAEDRVAVVRGLAEAHVSTDLYKADFRVLHVSGEMRWLRSRGRAEVDQRGIVVRRHGILMDVTAQKNAEGMQLTTTQLLETTQSVASVGGWALDIASEQLFWTHEAYRILETSPAAFNPSVDTVIGFCLPDSGRLLSAAFDAAMTRGTGYDLEVEALTTKGRLINVRVTCAVTMSNGQPVKLTGIFQDITARKLAANAYRESEDRFRLLVDGTSDLVTIVDAAGKLTYANNEAVRITGLALVDLIGQTLFDLVHPGDRVPALQWFADSLAAGGAQDALDVRFVHRDGQVRQFILSLTFRFDKKSVLTHIISIGHNITQRRKMQEEHELLAAIVDYSEYAIIGKTLDGRVTSWNAGAEKLLGYSAEEIVGTPVAGLIPDDVHAKERAILARMDAGETDRHFETTRLNKDGRLVQVSATISPIKDADGQVIGAAGIFRNITDRKLAEAAARENQARLELAIQVAEIGSWDWDFVSGDVNLSAEWKAQLGFADDEMSSQFSEFESRLHPEDRHRILEMVAAARVNPLLNRQSDFRLRHKDGSYRWMHSRSLVIYDAQGLPLRLVGAHLDLTDRKNADKQSFRSQRLESLGTLAGGVAHDLNNALTPILMSIEMLRMDYPNETALIDLVEANGLRAANMVRQLLTFPRGVSSERTEVGVGLLVVEMQNLMQGTFPKNINLRVVCEPMLPIVLGDATQLHQVLLNLCVNARDAMPDGGTLTIDAKYQRFLVPPTDTVTPALPGDYIVVTVSDTGVGVPLDVVEHIFDPFFTTKDVHKGTGLGLATALGIIKGHYGFIKVQSQPGQGTTFTVFLPTKDDVRVPPSVVTQEQLPQGHGERILFIEDEAAIREVMTRGLLRLNYQILTCVDGADGLAQALNVHNDIAAVVTDMHMPNMGGLAMAQALRRERPEMPLLVTSGRMDDEVAAELYSLGVTQLLAKPFTEKQLADALDKLLKTRRV